jgi:hypothetical protein
MHFIVPRPASHRPAAGLRPASRPQAAAAACPNTAGAIWRQVSQSMQVESTKKSPGAFSGTHLRGFAKGGPPFTQFYPHGPEPLPPAGSHPQVKWKRLTTGPELGAGEREGEAVMGLKIKVYSDYV